MLRSLVGSEMCIRDRNSSYWCESAIVNASLPSSLDLQKADAAAKEASGDLSLPCAAYRTKELLCARFFPRCAPDEPEMHLCAARCTVVARACDTYVALTAHELCQNMEGVATSSERHCFSIPYQQQVVPAGWIIAKVFLVTFALVLASQIILRLRKGSPVVPRSITRCGCCRFSKSTGARAREGHERLETQEIALDQISDQPEIACNDDEAEQEPLECRICKDGEGELLSPCNCQGSTGALHEECLSQWIAAQREAEAEHGPNGRNPMVCEVCLSEYNVTLESRIQCQAQGLCSQPSLVQYASACVVLLMIPVLITVLLRSCDHATTVAAQPIMGYEDDLAVSNNLCAENGHWGVVAIGSLLLLLTLSTLKKAYDRWHQLNEVLVLRPL
eukprot:TRINITY_DN19725_c0_g1_i1.p1 TRINITY_DN19725_c0_g1~~TRINITY_DN19725_c0_g1_i1.p1  ORF type:complete len:390 (-),score=70.84 TRINITY_DN19725_c0_g1_i1:526-1695(-)